MVPDQTKLWAREFTNPWFREQVYNIIIKFELDETSPPYREKKTKAASAFIKNKQPVKGG